MGATAQDVMNTDIESVRDDMPVRDLAAFLIDREISGAPVLDAVGRLVGVVSLTDIVMSDAEASGTEREESPSPFFTAGWERKMNLADFAEVPIHNEGLSVRDIMTPTVYTLPEDTPIHKIARTMVTGRIHRLLITHNEKVIGVVTSLDLLKLLCESP